MTNSYIIKTFYLKMLNFAMKKNDKNVFEIPTTLFFAEFTRFLEKSSQFFSSFSEVLI